MADDRADVVVVGAGVIGTVIGWLLARAGLDVCVVEADAIGSGSTGHGHGIVSLVDQNFQPGAHFDLGQLSAAMYPELTQALLEESGIDPLYHELDGLSLAIDDEEEAIFKAQFALHRHHLRLEWIDGQACRDLEPRITPLARGAICYRHGQVDAYRLANAATRAMERLGGRVLLRKVTGLISVGQRVTGVAFEGGRLLAKTVVLAMGAWVRSAWDWLHFPIPVRPLHGEVLNVHLPGEPLRVFILTARHGPIVPRRDGVVLVGSIGGTSMAGTNLDQLQRFDPLDQTWSQFDLSPKPENEGLMIERAYQIMPAIENATLLAHLAGVRPLSADRLPLIGPVPGWDGVLLAAGHGTKGIHLAPVTGHIIRDLIVHGGNTQPIAVKAFLPERFA